MIIYDHVERGLARLPDQFKGKQNLAFKYTVFLEQIQELEYVIADLMNLRKFRYWSGNAVDMAGEIVGEPRRGRNDENYWTAIRFKVALNRSCGQAETILSTIRDLLKPYKLEFTENFPAKVHVNIKSDTTVPSGFQDSVKSIALGGVAFTYTQSGTGLDFGFALENGIGSPDTAGFGELNHPEVGGGFVELVS